MLMLNILMENASRSRRSRRGYNRIVEKWIAKGKLPAGKPDFRIGISRVDVSIRMLWEDAILFHDIIWCKEIYFWERDYTTEL